ncbi:MAG TPA: hypothetical protein PLI09_24875 [Candidatus Hydrogenedentes bacterium]|nr:hypothetical protein [Candidatus Hydrogenedentota bacterium]
MKRLAVALVAVMVVSLCGWSFAANPPAAEHGTFIGKVETGTANGAKTVSITVTKAMSRQVKDINALNGKTLALVGPKMAAAEKFAGKEVEVTGILKENRTQLDVTSIFEKRPMNTAAVKQHHPAATHSPSPHHNPSPKAPNSTSNPAPDPSPASAAAPTK